MDDVTHFRVADLPQNRPTAFNLAPSSEQRSALAKELGLLGLNKLRFTGEISASGKSDWVLTGMLGATVVQPCVVSLDPVTTRIDEPVRRLFVADWTEPEDEEVEMTQDEETEALGTEIDPVAVMTEALALALPLYPRKPGTDLAQAVFTEPGTRPMSDEDARPFADLAALRDAMKKEQ
ncbi:MAG: YceD family protein [Pseudomonadota bacterium]